MHFVEIVDSEVRLPHRRSRASRLEPLHLSLSSALAGWFFADPVFGLLSQNPDDGNLLVYAIWVLSAVTAFWIAGRAGMRLP